MFYLHIFIKVVNNYSFNNFVTHRLIFIHKYIDSTRSQYNPVDDLELGLENICTSSAYSKEVEGCPLGYRGNEKYSL